MEIYKIFLISEWNLFEETGKSNGSAIDLSDGYIHFSTAKQLRETAQKYFKEESEFELLACDSKSLKKNIKWELSRGGDLFPHLYSQLLFSDIKWHMTIKLGALGHVFPSDIK